MTASKFLESGRRAIWLDRARAAPLIAASHSATQRRFPTLSLPMLALTYAIGVAGVLRDCRLWLHDPAWIDFHILFGVLLLLTILVQFAERKFKSPKHPGELRNFRRHLMRSVYLLLYVLFGVSQMIIACASPSNGAWQSAMPDLSEPLREYLVCGIVALLSIQFLSALECRADHQYHK